MRLLLIFALFYYCWGLSIVGFQQSTPVYYLNGNLVPYNTTQYTLTIACRNGESALLEGSTSQNIPEGVFVNCSGISRSVTKTLVGYTPVTASVFVADSYQSIIVAESRSTNALYHTALAYAANRQFSQVATSRKRGMPPAEKIREARREHLKNIVKRSYFYNVYGQKENAENYFYYYGDGTRGTFADNTHNGEVYDRYEHGSVNVGTASGFWNVLQSYADSAGAGAEFWLDWNVAMEQFEDVTDYALEGVLTSNLPYEKVTADQLLASTEALTGTDLSSCNTFFANGAGISGIKGCIYQTINTLDSYANELKLDQEAITATENQIQALAALINTAQTSVSAVVVSVTQVSQDLQNTLKTVSAGAYMQQLASLTSAGITASIENADATQNQNNQNIQTIIQQNQATSTLALQTLQNSLLSLQQQDQDQLNLVSQNYIQLLASTYAQVQQNIQLQNEQQALKTASAYNEFTTAINNLLTANSYTSQVVAAMNSKFADAYDAVVNLAVSATTVDTLCIDTFKTLSAAIDGQGLLPFISDWGNPPANTNVTTLWGTRVFNLDYPQILNTQTGQYRTCQSPFGVGQPWKAALNEKIAETVPITVSIPTTLDLNLPVFSDYVYLEVLVNGVWQYISKGNYIPIVTPLINPDSTASIVLCNQAFEPISLSFSEITLSTSYCQNGQIYSITITSINATITRAQYPCGASQNSQSTYVLQNEGTILLNEDCTSSYYSSYSVSLVILFPGFPAVVGGVLTIQNLITLVDVTPTVYETEFLTTTTNPATALGLRLQSYDRYLQQEAVTICYLYDVIFNQQSFSCVNSQNNSICTLILNNLSPHYVGYTPTFNCQVTLEGNGCTTYYLNETSNSTCPVLALNCSIPLLYENCTTQQTAGNYPLSNVYPGENVYFTAQGTFLGYVVDIYPQTPYSSNGFYLNQPSNPGNISLTNAFRIQLNSTSNPFQQYQAIYNSTAINLISAYTGNPLYLSDGSFLSGPNSTSPAVFRIVTVNGEPSEQDEGIPLDKRRSEKTKTREKRSTSSVTCPSIFELQVSGSARDQTKINNCTAVQGCVLARFQRIDQVVITNATNPSQSITLGIGTYQLKTDTQAFFYQGFSFGPCTQGYNLKFNSTMFFNITAGLRLSFSISYNGIINTAYFTSTTQDVSYGVLLDMDNLFSCPYTTSNCESVDFCSNSFTPASAWFTIDREPSYPVFNYFDVCIQNSQVSGSLTSNACSTLSTVPTQINLPSVYGILIYASTVTLFGQGVSVVTYPQINLNGQTFIQPFIPPTANGLASTNVLNSIGEDFTPTAFLVWLYDNANPNPITAGFIGPNLFSTYFANKNAASLANFSFNANLSPFTCFANCLDVGTDRASCLELDYDRCVWAFNSTTESNSCQPFVEPVPTIITTTTSYVNYTYNVTTQVAALHQPEPCTQTGSTYSCNSGGNYYGVSLTYCGNGGSEGNPSDTAFDQNTNGYPVFTPTSSNCGGQISYFAIQISAPFVVITCNGQSYAGGLTTGTGVIINNPTCSSSYTVKNPINITFITGPSGGYVTANLTNLFSYTNSSTTDSSLDWPPTFNSSFTGSYTNCYYAENGLQSTTLQGSGYSITNTVCANGQIESLLFSISISEAYLGLGQNPTSCDGYTYLYNVQSSAYIVNNPSCISGYTVNNPLTVSLTSTVNIYVTFNNLINPSAPKQVTTTTSNQPVPYLNTDANYCTSNCANAFTFTEYNCVNTNPTRVTSGYTITNTTCANGQIQSVSIVLTGYGSYTDCNADFHDSSYTSNTAYLIQNTLCLSNYTVNNPLTVTFPSTIPFTLTFSNLIYNPALQTIQSCNVQELALGFPTSVSSQPAAWICNQVSNPLGYNSGNYELVTFPVGGTSSSGFNGTFLSQPFTNGEPPHCVWNPTDYACENYDIQYSSSVVDVVYCRDRLWQANNVGACITSPTNEIIYNGLSYTPRCVYVLPYGSAEGKCVTYAFDNSPTTTINSGAQKLGPYNLPYSYSLSLGTAKTSSSILTQCLTPGTQCYFETAGAITSTTAWYQGVSNSIGNNITAFCNNYNSDSLGCPLKTYVNGVSICTYYSNGLCAVNCNQFNNNGMGCVNNLPYNTCYYTKSTGLCQNNNNNFLIQSSCSGYNCYSISTICYAYSNNQAGCEANSLCIWYNYANASNNYCDLKQNVQDPQCAVNGVALSFCNTTYDQGLNAAITAIVSSCNINQTLSFGEYISTCVQLFDTTVNPPQNCVYSQFGSTLQFCTPANSATIATYESQFGSYQPLTQVTFDQYAQSQAPASTVYTLPFNQLPLRSGTGATIQNMQNLGILLIPDDPTGFFPCNASYTAVGQYCCLTSEVESNLLGQCQDTYYVNTYHPSYLLQEVYVDLCQNELQANEEVVVTNIEFPIYTAGMTEPLPGQDGYTLDSRYCPAFSNGTDYPPGYTGNYSMYAYLLSDQAFDLQIGLLEGQSECTIDFNVNNTNIQLLRIGSASWYAYANALTVSLYNGTLYNVTYFSNFTSHFLLSGNIDTTYRNMTTDFPTMFYDLIESDVQYWINNYNVRYGPRVDMWGCQIPGGISTRQKYIQGLSTNTYAQLGNEAIFGAVSNRSLPVYRAKSYIDTMGATVIVSNPGNSSETPVVYSPINYIVKYDNINLLPALNQAWVFANTAKWVYSTPFSSNSACQGIDFMAITSDISMGYVFNYTAAVARCPFFDPKWFQFHIGNNACFRNQNLPYNETDFLGVQFGQTYTSSSNLQTALSLSILYSMPLVDENGEYLWQWWNNTLNTDGSDAVLAFVDALQAKWYALGCNEQLVNYIPPQLSTLIDNSTLIQAEDFFRPIYIAYKAALASLGPNGNSTQAINAISLEYLAPTVNTYSNAYCGNCGLDYGTQCIPATTVTSKSSIYSCQYGVSLASTAFDISITQTIDTYSPHEGTADLLLTFQIQQITQLQNVESLICPTSKTPFSCSNSAGFVYCTFSATNPSNSSNIDVVFRITANGTISTCSLQQTSTIAPGESYSSQFNLCPDSTSILTIETPAGSICYKLVQVIGNYTSISSITNSVAASVYESVYNGTNTDLVNLLDQLSAATDQVNLLQAQTFSISTNITTFQSTLNDQYQQFLAFANETLIEAAIQNASLASLIDTYGNLTINYILPLTTNLSYLASSVAQQYDQAQQLQADVAAIQASVDNITALFISKQEYYEKQFGDEIAGYNNQSATANGIIKQFGNFFGYNEQYPYNYFTLFQWISAPTLVVLVLILALLIYLVWKVTTENYQQSIWDQDFEDFRLNIKRNPDLNIAVGPNETPQDVVNSLVKGYDPQYISSETQRYPPNVYLDPIKPMVLHEQNIKFENPDETPNLNPTNSASGPRQRFINPLVETEGPPPPPPPPPPKDTTTKPPMRKSRNKRNGVKTN